MSKNKYRVKKNVIKETVTGREIATYYSLEKYRKKYFIFGPYVWVDYYERYKSFINWEDHVYINRIRTFISLESANIACERLNKNLSEFYNDSVIIRT